MRISYFHLRKDSHAAIAEKSVPQLAVFRGFFPAVGLSVWLVDGSVQHAR